MATSGQTINDRINAARYALAGQGLARCVCKATTEEVIGPKKKHLEYLIACTHEPNVSIPQLANLLIERTNHIQWVVVFKALVTVHQLMSYGNERFIQYLASSNYSFELSTFLDKTSGRDFSMSTFIRRYSRYINEKAISYRKSAFDFCKIKRGNEGVLRTMPIDRLLKTLPILQDQLDALLDFDCTAGDLNNGVINACFMLLFRDLIGLFACHNDGIINLLNRYFTLNKKMCREAFDLYKKFLVRMDKVSEFLRVAEVVGIDKDEIPDLRRAPSSLIDALEQHLQNLESNKKILKQTGSSNNTDGSKSTHEQLVGNLSLTGGGSSSTNNTNNNNMSSNNSSGTNEDPGALGGGSTSFKDDEVRRALEEEARVLSLYGSSEAHNKSTSRTSPGQLKTNASQRNSTTSSAGADSGAESLKFAVSTAPKTIDDIFGDSNSFATATNNNDHGASKNSCLDGSANTKHHRNQQRPDFDLIKTAIQSATTTLEKANVSSDNNHTTAAAKASDDLFGLLDTSSTHATDASNLSQPASTTNTAGSIGHQQQSTNPMSPFATSATLTPFDLPLNGQSGASNNNQFNTATSMKPGNPFPEVAVAPSFPASFETGATLAAQPATSSQTAAFKSTTNMSHQPTGANYTSLGGLEGFGDVLQPTFAAGNRSSYMNQTHGGANSSGGKSAFTSSGGLSSTGLFKGDLDSTLANLAQNLTFEGMSKPKK